MSTEDPAVLCLVCEAEVGVLLKVRVNAIAPEFIEGDWLKEGLGEFYEPVRSGFAQRSLVERVSTPEDVAPGILSLIEGSAVATGQVLIADGGVGVSG